MISLYTDERMKRFAAFHCCKEEKETVIYIITGKKPFSVQGTVAYQNCVIDEKFAGEVKF